MVFFSSFSAANCIGWGLTCLSIWVLRACVFDPIFAEEEEKSTFVGRNSKVWFIWTWSLLIFILCGIVYPPEAPPGESNMEYGGAVMLMVCVVALFWGGFSIRKTESTFKAEMKRKAETKTLAELMSINMGGA